MRKYLFLLCCIPVICFGQYRADRARTNPNVADGNGYCFRGHTAATSAYCADATALFARMTTPPNDVRKTVINNFIVGAKTAGIWQKWDAVYVLAAADQQAALLNWIADTNNATAENSPSFVADSGFKSNGTSSWVNSHYNPTQDSVHFSIMDASVSVYCVTSSAVNDQYDIGCADYKVTSYSWVMINSRNGANFANASLCGTSAYDSYNCGTSSLGLTSMSRNASTFYLYKDGSPVANNAYAPAYTPNLNIAICTNNFWNGTQAGYSSRRISFVSFGALLSATEQAELATLVEAYMDSVGCGKP